MNDLSIVILTGQSGSGKSTAMRVLEDQGFYCVDNLPTKLVEQLVQTVRDETGVRRLALIMDARNPRSLAEAPALVDRLRAQAEVRVVYFEAIEDALLRRYSETRRRHPLDTGAGLRDAISRERELLSPLREIADDTLDTSAMSPHELKLRVYEKIAGVSLRENLRIAIVSFGFKHGVPVDADMMLDVRFLANPYFVPELRPLTGLDPAVRDMVLGNPDTPEFIEHAMGLMSFLIPRFQAEGKRYLTVAVGCTGGQHRSVAISVALAERLRAQGHKIDLRHRDMRTPALSRTIGPGKETAS